MSRRALLAIVLCTSLAEAASLEVQVRDSSGAPVADAVVHAIPPSGPADARGARTVTIEQRDREFVPFVTVLQTGTPVSFPNRDPILHHVYSFSPAKSFEIKLYTGTPPGEVLFDKPGVVTLGCNIHDWMVAYIVVVQTPHFGRTDKGGVAHLRDLPAGAYEVRAWHPHQRTPLGPQRAVLEGQSAGRVAFVLDTSPKKARYRPPLDRARY
jgi:plastocyanin